MIEHIIDLQSNVLGFKASGEVTAENYQTVLVPAIEEGKRSAKGVLLEVEVMWGCLFLGDRYGTDRKSAVLESPSGRAV